MIKLFFTLPGRWICPGIIPILHSPGLIIPGQLGPINRVLFWEVSAFLTLTMSFCGIPSVIQTANGISASIASITAAAANLKYHQNQRSDKKTYRWWDVDNSSIWLNSIRCFSDRVENGKVKVSLTSLLWGHSTNNICSVCEWSLSMKSSLFASESLHQKLKKTNNFWFEVCKTHFGSFVDADIRTGCVINRTKDLWAVHAELFNFRFQTQQIWLWYMLCFTLI